MTFSSRSSLAPCKAFTLVELLTVIVIIAILMGLLLPAVNQVRIQANKTKAKGEAIAIVSAVKAFYAEYGKYPSNPASAPNGDQIIGPSNGGLIDVLRATQISSPSWNASNAQNTRGVVYLDAQLVKNPDIPKGGIATKAVTSSGGPVAIGDYIDPLAWAILSRSITAIITSLTQIPLLGFRGRM